MLKARHVADERSVGKICYDVPMSAKKDFSGAIPLHIPYSPRRCPACGQEQRYGYCSSGRYIFRLDRLLSVTSQVVYCVNPRCTLMKRDMHPPEEWALAPPYKGFGWDVIATTGQLRHGQRMTRVQIKAHLKEVYGLEISEREVNTLYDLYGTLVTNANLEDPELIEALQGNRAMVLSLDAAKPMLGHEAVWFVSELMSGRTLVARALRSQTENDLIELLRPVKAFARRIGVPVAGIVSDAEASIRKAVKAVWPRAPHQLCQLHFVENLAEDLAKEDGGLRMEVRKSFRQMRQLERSVAQSAGGDVSQARADVVLGLCLAIRAILRHEAEPPFHPPGLLLFERLTELRERIRRMRREKGGPAFGRLRSYCRWSTSSGTRCTGCERTTPTFARWVTSCSRRVEPAKVPSVSFAS